MGNNEKMIGDLVRLTKRGVEYYVYRGYHADNIILTSSGIVVAHKKANVKVWFAPYSLWIAKKYLKKMNKS